MEWLLRFLRQVNEMETVFSTHAQIDFEFSILHSRKEIGKNS
jgi:hypothetical protein